jgi:hypothetical protein
MESRDYLDNGFRLVAAREDGTVVVNRVFDSMKRAASHYFMGLATHYQDSFAVVQHWENGMCVDIAFLN